MPSFLLFLSFYVAVVIVVDIVVCVCSCFRRFSCRFFAVVDVVVKVDIVVVVLIVAVVVVVGSYELILFRP